VNVARVVGETVLITGFVLVMMLLVEYVNVLTAGVLQRWLTRPGAAGYLGVMALGTSPGCLGAFANVALYVHGFLTFGAISGSMIATSGDEAFVMLALFPGKALLLFGLLFLYGLVVAFVVDRLTRGRCYAGGPCDSGMVVHGTVQAARERLLRRESWGRWTPLRAALAAGLAAYAGAAVIGLLPVDEPGWVRWTVMSVGLVGLAVVATAPEHFLVEHLWKHVVREHLVRIFLWVLGVSLLVQWVAGLHGSVRHALVAHPGWALLASAAIGLIPESGPHLVFVTLFAQGLVPFSVLATSSIVQDGHGTLPLLAESRREWVKVKAVNVAAGLLLGGALLLLGW
jgi:hypothetical protein